MPITTCEHCKAPVEHSNDQSGDWIPCPQCGKAVTLPTDFETKLRLAAAKDVQNFLAINAVLPVGINYACAVALVAAIISAICINIAAFQSYKTRLGFLIWPWMALFIIPMQWWTFHSMSQRRRPALAFRSVASSGFVFLFLFWAYMLGYQGLWRLLQENGQLGFYPTLQRGCFFAGGLFGVVACWQLRRAALWIRKHITVYEQLLIRPF